MSQVIADAGVRGFQPSLVGGTGTTAKIFPSLLGTGFNNGGGILPQPAGVVPAALIIPGSSIYEGKPITVKASGTLFMHGASPTVNLTLYNGVSMTPGSNTVCLVGASALSSLTTATQYPFALQVTLQGDSISGIVQLYNATSFFNGTTLGTITLTNLTGVSFVAGTSAKTTTAALSLVIGATFGVSDALNECQLMQFVAEA